MRLSLNLLVEAIDSATEALPIMMQVLSLAAASELLIPSTITETFLAGANRMTILLTESE